MLLNAFKPAKVFWDGPYLTLDECAWILLRYDMRGTHGFWGLDDIKFGALMSRRQGPETSDVLCMSCTILAFDTERLQTTRMAGSWTAPVEPGMGWDAEGIGHMLHTQWMRRCAREHTCQLPLLTSHIDLVPAPGILLQYQGWQGRQPDEGSWPVLQRSLK